MRHVTDFLSEFDRDAELFSYMQQIAAARSQQASQEPTGSLADPAGLRDAVVTNGIGFGAGVLNPFGLNAMLARRFGGERGAQAAGLLDYAQQRAPVAHAMGSAVPTAFAVTAPGTLRAGLGVGSWLRDATGGIIPLAAAFGYGRHLYDEFNNNVVPFGMWSAARRLGVPPNDPRVREAILRGEIDTDRPQPSRP